MIHCDVTSAAGIKVETAEELCKCLYKREYPQILLGGKCRRFHWAQIVIYSSTKGCFSAAKDTNQMADAPKWLVFSALRIASISVGMYVARQGAI